MQKETNSKIRNLVSAGMFSEQSLIIILSAVYFKGKWKNAFVERDTHKKYFHESEDKRRQVDHLWVELFKRRNSFTTDLNR